MLTKIKNRVNSDRADANSVSQILWIAIAAAVISVVGLAIYNATTYSGYKSAARLQSLDCYIEVCSNYKVNNLEDCSCTMKKEYDSNGKWLSTTYNYSYEQAGDKKVLTDRGEKWYEWYPSQRKDIGDEKDIVKKPK